jgi:hypothetical protein
VAVPAATFTKPMAMDPGKHTVIVNAQGHTPNSYDVELHEKEHLALVVTVGASTQVDKPPPPPPAEHKPMPRWIGWAAVGGGAVFVGGGVTLLVLRNSDINTLKDSCPGGKCPVSKQSDLSSKHDQAQLFGPLGVGLIAVGAVAAGAGVYLLTRPRVVPTASWMPGGGTVGVGGAF